MSYAVPMVAMPFINDQISNAKRIAELGIGKKVRPFPSSGKQLYETVMEVSHDRNIRNRCAAVKDLLRVCLVSNYDWIFEQIFLQTRKHRRRILEGVCKEMLTQYGGKSAGKIVIGRY